MTTIIITNGNNTLVSYKLICIPKSLTSVRDTGAGSSMEIILTEGNQRSASQLARNIILVQDEGGTCYNVMQYM